MQRYGFTGTEKSDYPEKNLCTRLTTSSPERRPKSPIFSITLNTRLTQTLRRLIFGNEDNGVYQRFDQVRETELSAKMSAERSRLYLELNPGP